MNQVDRYLKSAKTAVLIPIVGGITWVISLPLFFFLFRDIIWLSLSKPHDVPLWADWVSFIFLTVWILMPLTSLLGILAGCRSIWLKGFSWLAAGAILLNVIWLMAFIYCLPIYQQFYFF